jgi:hypothetical protein
VPTSVQLIFNTASGLTANQSVRSAIAAGITQSVVVADLTGGWSDGGTTVNSQVRLPSTANSAEQGTDNADQSPVVTGEQAASSALAGAGFVRNGLYVSKDGEVLRLTLGYPAGDGRLAAAARTIQRQLGGIGIEIDLLPDAAPNLVETRIATGEIDLALLAVPRGIADAVSAASAFGCPSGSVLGIGSTVTAEPSPTEAAQPEAPAGSGTATTPDSADDPTPDVRTGNLSGYCEPSTQRILFDALVGAGAVAAADPALWADLPVLPLIQPSGVFAVSESLRTVLDWSHEGWMWSGPLSGLSSWPVG